MTKSTRLTNDIRNDIIKSVVDEWQKKNTKPLIDEAHDKLARKLWTQHQGAKKAKELMDFKYKDFLKKTDYVQAAINGQVQRFHLLESLPTDNDNSYRQPVIAMLRDDDKDYAAFLKVEEKTKAWREEGNELERETRSIVYSVNTTNQLIELWPQCEPFLPAHIADPDKGVKLPALQISRLNERLGLKGTK